jgi:hypothetical protein
MIVYFLYIFWLSGDAYCKHNMHPDSIFGEMSGTELPYKLVLSVGTGVTNYTILPLALSALDYSVWNPHSLSKRFGGVLLLKV